MSIERRILSGGGTGPGGGDSGTAVTSVIAHGAKADARRVLDAVATASSTTLTSATAAFTAADTGKKAVIWGAGPSGGTLTTTISYVDATTVTLADAASTSGTGLTAHFGTDDAAAFQAAADALPEAGGTVRIPAGAYLVGTAISHDKRIRWEGDGGGARPDSAIDDGDGVVTAGALFNATHVWWIGPATGAAFTCAAHGSAFVGWCLDNASAAAPTAGAGLVVTHGYYNRYQDFTVSRFWSNIDVQNGSEWHANGLTIYNPANIGLKVANSTHGDEGDMSIVASNFVTRDFEPYAAIQWTNAGGMMVTNCKFNNDFRADGSKALNWRRLIDAPMTAWTSNLLVANNSLENYAETAVHVETAGHPFGNVKISGNEFLAVKGVYEPRAVQVVGDRAGGGLVTGVVVAGNVFNTIGGSAHPAVSLVGCDRVSVTADNSLPGYNLLVDMVDCQAVTPVHLLAAAAPDVSNTGRWVKPQGQQITDATAATLDRMYLIPVHLSTPFYLLKLACGVQAGAAGALVQFAFYADNGQGQPTGSPLGTTTAVAAEAAFEAPQGSVDHADGVFGLPPGLYWVGVVAHTAAPTLYFGRNSVPAFSTAFPNEHTVDDRTMYSTDGVTGTPGAIGTLNSRTVGPVVSIGLS